MFVSVLLCGKTDGLVNLLRHQFQNCLHKIKLVVEDGFLLPGGGKTEALCIANLRQELSKFNTELSNADLQSSQSHGNLSADVSVAMATSWMGDKALMSYWRRHVYEICIEGLLEYIARVMVNSGSCLERDLSGARTMALAEELVRSVERDVTVQSVELEVLEVAKSKMAAWRRALELLRLLFLSTKVACTVYKVTLATLGSRVCVIRDDADSCQDSCTFTK